MLNDKIKLEEYFKEEIKRVSDIEIEQIENEISEIRDRSLQGLEAEAKREAMISRDQELKELQSDHAIRVSKTHEETNRKLMKKRRELADKVFNEAVQEIKNFTLSKDYAEYLNKKAKALAENSFGSVVIYVAQKDEALLSDICKAYGAGCEGKVDPEIMVGGLRMECEAKGIVVDETFDAGIDEQRSWFYTNSGLFIK